MKGFIKILICVAAALLGATVLSGCSDVPQEELANELTFNLEGISELTISYDAETVTLFEGQNENLVIREYMTENNSRYYAKVDQSGNSIHVSEGEKPKLAKKFRRNVEIYLPDSYDADLTLITTSGTIEVNQDKLNLNSIRADSTSGMILFNNISAPEIYLTTTSGRIEGANLSYGDVFLDTTSGSVEIQSVNCPEDEVRVQGTSGNFRFGTITAGEIGIETTSGTVECEELDGAVSYTSTSGSAEVESASGSGGYHVSQSGSLDVIYKRVTGDLSFINKNGDIDITLPEELAFKFEAKTKNGTISTPFQENLTVSGDVLKGTVGSAPTVSVSLETKNGSIRVN